MAPQPAHAPEPDHDGAPVRPALQLVAPASPDPGVHEHHGRSSLVRSRLIDAPQTPTWVRATFAVLYALAAVLVGHQAFGWLAGERSDALIDIGVNNVVFLGSAGLAAWRAARMPVERAAWSFIAAGLFLYALGDLVWSAFYADSDAPVTLADACYLCWAPLTFIGLVLLVRSRIPRFEVSRWIDGVAAALLVSAPGVVFILEPTIRASQDSTLVKVVSVAYPVGDIVVLGATVGVIALCGWHPGRAWSVLAIGFTAFVAADSLYAVQNLTGAYSLGTYDWLWPVAGLLIATAAWLRPVRHEEVHAWGWRAIALPVLCQLAPIGLMLMKDDPPSEQLIMSAVLAIVLVQIVVTRPRGPAVDPA